MAQMNWVYLDNAGGQHRIGMYHGDKTRHLLIYCGNKIVQIDFSVKETTFYSFFIEDELCEVHLVKDQYGAFGYEFKINKEANTPLNQQRKNILRIERKQFAIGIGIMALFIVALLGFNRYQKYKKAYDAMAESSIIGHLTPGDVSTLQQNGRFSNVTFFLVQEQGKPVAHYTFYTSDSLLVSGKVSAPPSGKLLLPTGFAIGDRHEFKAQYLPTNPSLHRINFYEPSPATIAKYLEESIATQQLLHPENTATYNSCLVNTIKNNKHWLKLSTIINQNDSKNNKNEYLRLIRDVDIVHLIAQQCGI